MNKGLLSVDEALAQQQVDRNVPLGELLVRMGVVTAEDLRVALARKMAYPLVNVDEFPLEVAALARLSYAVASRLQAVPLLLRGGRLVVAIDDVEQNLALVDLAREHFPQLTIVARARNAQHWTQLYQRGVRLIERETLDAALMSARSVLEAVGWQPHRARTLAMRFRRHSIEQLVAMAPHLGDEARLISISKAGRQQLEQLLAQERELAERGRGGGWQATPDDAGRG